jgi:hypothetical protein
VRLVRAVSRLTRPKGAEEPPSSSSAASHNTKQSTYANIIHRTLRTCELLTGDRAGLSVMALLMPRIGAHIPPGAQRNSHRDGAQVRHPQRRTRRGPATARHDDVPRTFMGINVPIDVVDAAAFLAAGRRREIGAAATALGSGLAVGAAGLGAAGLVALPGRASLRHVGRATSWAEHPLLTASTSASTMGSVTRGDRSPRRRSVVRQRRKAGGSEGDPFDG